MPVRRVDADHIHLTPHQLLRPLQPRLLLQLLRLHQQQLLRLLLTDPYGHYLLVVGSYRAEAIAEAHPLHQQLEALRKDRVATTTLALQPLRPVDIAQLLGEALAMAPAALGELAAVVHGKTDGNPFFIEQFITGLYRDELLRYDAASQGWQWELGRIQALPATDNVADIMVVKLRQLTPRALQILQTAACLGSQFELETVAQVSGASVAECSSALSEAVRAGLLLSPDSAYYLAVPPPEREGGAPATGGETAVTYKFLHERIQQAVYATLAATERPACHLRIGELRLAQWGQDAPTGRLFDLVNHLNLGSPRMRDSGDAAGLLALARLNLLAGKRAKATAAFHAAVGFFTAGTTLLPESAWGDQHELLFELYLERAHTESLNGYFPEAEALLLALQKHARTAVEHGLVSLRLCELYYARADFPASIRVT